MVPRLPGKARLGDCLTGREGEDGNSTSGLVIWRGKQSHREIAGSGDGKTDVAVWRESTGMWYVKCSHDNTVMSKAHGQRGDVPIATKRNN